MKVRTTQRLLEVLLFVVLCSSHDTRAEQSLADYRYFRALSIELLGRPANRAELATFERPDFDLDAWLDRALAGPGYAERMRRVYMDRLRLELPPSFQFLPNAIVLRRVEVLGPDGPVYVYFRRNQRRVPDATDGDFCLTSQETGQQYPPNAAPTGTPIRVSRALLDERTVVVKPWWLYADYQTSEPKDRIDARWEQRFPGFSLVPALLEEPNGTPTTAVRVCKEEAQPAVTGAVHASGRTPQKPGAATPGRLTRTPNDSAFARTHKGKPVSCLSGTGFRNSAQCGCGPGLERCIPAPGEQVQTPVFMMPTATPLGLAAPFDRTRQSISAWMRTWWSAEATQFLDELFQSDRDVREILTSRRSSINGPLAQFYRFFSSATCCGQGEDFEYTTPEPLFEPGAVPPRLLPHDTATWTPVADRGAQASGLLTMPIFLTKFGTRRARANAVYNVFLCKEFISESAQLAPSNEPDLTKRAGCSTCHKTLEPLAAFFTRVQESDWTYLPSARFPMSRPECARADGKVKGSCKRYYDREFTTDHSTMLFGAYAAPPNAEAGPRGLAQSIASSPEFAPCVVNNVASALLGRPLSFEDEAWKESLTQILIKNGFRLRAVVKAILTSPRYRAGNDQKGLR